MNEPNKQISPENAQEWMSAHLDGMLDADESAVFQAYLDRTPGAKAELADMKALVGHLGDLPDVAPPADLYDRVRAELDAEQDAESTGPEQPAYSITPWLRRAAGIAAVLLIARVGYHELQQEQAPRDARTVLQPPESAQEEDAAPEEMPEAVILAEEEERLSEAHGTLDFKAAPGTEDRAKKMIGNRNNALATVPGEPLPEPEPAQEAEAEESAIEVGAVLLDRLEDLEAGERQVAPLASAPLPAATPKPATRIQPKRLPDTSDAFIVNGGATAVPVDLDELQSQVSGIAGRKKDDYDSRDYEARDRKGALVKSDAPAPVRDIRRDVVMKTGEHRKDENVGGFSAGGGPAAESEQNAPVAPDMLAEVAKDSTPVPGKSISLEKVAPSTFRERRREHDGAIWKQDAAEALGDEGADDDLGLSVGDVKGRVSGNVREELDVARSKIVPAEIEAIRTETEVARRPVQPSVSPDPTGSVTAPARVVSEVGAKASAPSAPARKTPVLGATLQRKDIGTGSSADREVARYYDSPTSSTGRPKPTLHASGYTSLAEGESKNEEAGDALTADTLTLLGSDKDTHPMRVQASITEVDALITRFTRAKKQKERTLGRSDRRSTVSTALDEAPADTSGPTGVTSGPHAAGKTLRVFKIDRDDYDAFMTALAKIGEIEAKPAAPDPEAKWFFFRKETAGTITIYLMVDPPAAPETDPKSE